MSKSPSSPFVQLIRDGFPGMNTLRPPAPCLVWNRPSIQRIPSITAFHTELLQLLLLRGASGSGSSSFCGYFQVGQGGCCTQKLHNTFRLRSGTIRIHSRFHPACFYYCAANGKECFTRFTRRSRRPQRNSCASACMDSGKAASSAVERSELPSPPFLTS